MYDWDERKRQDALERHGVDFAEVQRFDWMLADVTPDVRRDYHEGRFRAVGPIGNRLHVLIFTPRAGRLRVISLRKANRREVRAWYAGRN